MGTQAAWFEDRIAAAVAPLLPGFAVEAVAEIDSTNTELMRRARAGRAEPVLLVAERQTAGRGRLGRPWQSAQQGEQQNAASLTFSLGLSLAPRDWSGLSLAVGVSVVDSLHADLQLKWPNDVWLHGRKLAGILIETASVGDQRVAVVGIGINIAPRAGDGLSTAPAWLQEVLPGVDAGQALLRIAAPLVQALKAFEIGGFAPFQAQFDQRDLLRDRAVNLSNGTVGMARGVDAQGGLLLQTPDGLQTVTSAEVSVRPAATSTPAV